VRGAGQIADGQPRIASAQLRWRQQLDIGAMRHLERMVRAQDRHPGCRGEEQVAGLDEADLRPLVSNGQHVANPTQEADAEQADGDVHRRRELLPDRACRQCRAGLAVAGVALQHHDLAGEGRVGGEPVGDGTAHRPAADDHDPSQSHAPLLLRRS
jgi:hypothetical protein